MGVASSTAHAIEYSLLSVSADIGAPTFQQKDIPPPAVQLAKPLPRPNDAEATPLVERDTCAVLRKDASLECPKAVLFRIRDKMLKQHSADRATASGSRYIDTHFSYASVNASARDRT